MVMSAIWMLPEGEHPYGEAGMDEFGHHTQVNAGERDIV